MALPALVPASRPLPMAAADPQIAELRRGLRCAETGKAREAAASALVRALVSAAAALLPSGEHAEAEALLHDALAVANRDSGHWRASADAEARRSRLLSAAHKVLACACKRRGSLTESALHLGESAALQPSGSGPAVPAALSGALLRLRKYDAAAVHAQRACHGLAAEAAEAAVREGRERRERQAAADPALLRCAALHSFGLAKLRGSKGSSEEAQNAARGAWRAALASAMQSSDPRADNGGDLLATLLIRRGWTEPKERPPLPPAPPPKQASKRPPPRPVPAAVLHTDVSPPRQPGSHHHRPPLAPTPPPQHRSEGSRGSSADWGTGRRPVPAEQSAAVDDTPPPQVLLPVLAEAAGGGDMEWLRTVLQAADPASSEGDLLRQLVEAGGGEQAMGALHLVSSHAGVVRRQSEGTLEATPGPETLLAAAVEAGGGVGAVAHLQQVLDIASRPAGRAASDGGAAAFLAAMVEAGQPDVPHLRQVLQSTSPSAAPDVTPTPLAVEAGTAVEHLEQISSPTLDFDDLVRRHQHRPGEASSVVLRNLRPTGSPVPLQMGVTRFGSAALSARPPVPSGLQTYDVRMPGLLPVHCRLLVTRRSVAAEIFIDASGGTWCNGAELFGARSLCAGDRVVLDDVAAFVVSDAADTASDSEPSDFRLQPGHVGLRAALAVAAGTPSGIEALLLSIVQPAGRDTEEPAEAAVHRQSVAECIAELRAEISELAAPAAVCIQMHWRGYQARREFDRRRALRSRQRRKRWESDAAESPLQHPDTLKSPHLASLALAAEGVAMNALWTLVSAAGGDGGPAEDEVHHTDPQGRVCVWKLTAGALSVTEGGVLLPRPLRLRLSSAPLHLELRPSGIRVEISKRDGPIVLPSIARLANRGGVAHNIPAAAAPSASPPPDGGARAARRSAEGKLARLLAEEAEHERWSKRTEECPLPALACARVAAEGLPYLGLLAGAPLSEVRAQVPLPSERQTVAPPPLKHTEAERAGEAASAVQLQAHTGPTQMDGPLCALRFASELGECFWLRAVAWTASGGPAARIIENKQPKDEQWSGLHADNIREYLGTVKLEMIRQDPDTAARVITAALRVRAAQLRYDAEAKRKQADMDAVRRYEAAVVIQQALRSAFARSEAAVRRQMRQSAAGPAALAQRQSASGPAGWAQKQSAAPLRAGQTGFVQQQAKLIDAAASERPEAQPRPRREKSEEPASQPDLRMTECIVRLGEGVCCDVLHLLLPA
eukprot:TRINITY_DN29664_c0_g1_i1.p1 TRINITY_DN29664_c0_g1~~TRINITY_DN29664_c0_g1_i1.p1  ORF type:complete len:1255 (+),score=362.10 TRINITY_DN29664_c0_g1_i1:60-3767(+)